MASAPCPRVRGGTVVREQPQTVAAHPGLFRAVFEVAELVL
ncbi:hypothetical protein ACWGNM_41310 [Streptomyces sp. NPDC055796]